MISRGEEAGKAMRRAIKIVKPHIMPLDDSAMELTMHGVYMLVTRSETIMREVHATMAKRGPCLKGPRVLRDEP